MTVPVRLSAFAAGLVVIAAGAAAAGGVTQASPPLSGCAIPPDGGMAMASGAPLVPGADGTRGSLAGVTLAPLRRSFPAGRSSTWRFRITNCDGGVIRSFQRDQTKLLHLIVARDDLTGYQHLHPTLHRDGTWTVDIAFRRPGRYRAMADFTTRGRRYVLGATLVAPGAARAVPLPPASTRASVGGYDVALRRDGHDFTFEITRDGRAVTGLQPYLGAYGHLVALDSRDLAYSHVHPTGESLSAGTIAFEAELQRPGAYRLFLQFRAGGRVHTAAFTQEVRA